MRRTTRIRRRKARISGITTRDVLDQGGREAELGGLVVQLAWDLIQPTEGGPIDEAGVGYRAWGDYLAARAHGRPIRLRIYSGWRSPPWVRNLGAGPIVIFDEDGGLYEVPCWWDPQVHRAWADLMRKVAALVERDPLVHEVVSHPASTVFAEPCQRDLNDWTRRHPAGSPHAGKTNAQVYFEAGLPGADLDASGAVADTDPVDWAALTYPVELVGGVPRWRTFGFETTLYSFSFNPVQSFRVLGTAPFDYRPVNDANGATARLVALASANLGSQVVLANNSLLVPIGQRGVRYAALLGAMVAAERSANSFQTATLAKITAAYRVLVPAATEAEALTAVCDVGFGLATSTSHPDLFPPGVSRLRARALEMPRGWDRLLSAEQVAAYASAGAANSGS